MYGEAGAARSSRTIRESRSRPCPSSAPALSRLLAPVTRAVTLRELPVAHVVFVFELLNARIEIANDGVVEGHDDRALCRGVGSCADCLLAHAPGPGQLGPGEGGTKFQDLGKYISASVPEHECRQGLRAAVVTMIVLQYTR